jgi:hypothetical protein
MAHSVDVAAVLTVSWAGWEVDTVGVLERVDWAGNAGKS